MKLISSGVLLKADIQEEEAFSIIRDFLSVNQYIVDHIEITTEKPCEYGLIKHEHKSVRVKGRFFYNWGLPDLSFEICRDDDGEGALEAPEECPDHWGEIDSWSLESLKRAYAMLQNYFAVREQEEGRK